MRIMILVEMKRLEMEVVMPSKHKGHPTIAFRPSTPWQYALIEERAMLSGMKKKDFYIRSCIYSNICVIGRKENVQKIVDAIQEMSMTMKEIVSQLQTGDFVLSEHSYMELRNDLLALSVTVVDILNGAAYLYNKKPDRDNEQWKKNLELEQFREVLRKDEMKSKSQN